MNSFVSSHRGGFPVGENKRMTIALFSGSLDKLTGAGIILSGAAAQDMDIDVYVLLQGARVFMKKMADKTQDLELAENAKMRDEFLASLKRLNVKPWLEFFREAKELATVRIHICGLAGKVWGGEKLDDFVDLVDDIVGIGECITAMEESDVSLFI
jgi:peroxiredoxin family protein